MKVHGLILSPNVRKVVVALNVKGIEFENNPVLPGAKSPELLEVSPLGLIPAIEDGDFAFSDSAIILEYLDEKFPDTPLMPSNPKDRASSRWFTEYGGSVVFPACAVLYTQLVANPYFFKLPTDESKVAEAIDKTLPPILDYLEAHVPSEGFLFGGLGAADISLISPLINAGYAGYQIDTKRWPKIAEFVERGKAHPAFAACLRDEEKLRQTFRAKAS